MLKYLGCYYKSQHGSDSCQTQVEFKKFKFWSNQILFSFNGWMNRVHWWTSWGLFCHATRCSWKLQYYWSIE